MQNKQGGNGIAVPYLWKEAEATDKLYYDLHIHSALSPCGDEDMTPNNIVNMAALKGLNVIAVTDHNSCGNCAAVAEAAKKAGILAVPGMELCTAEEIHLLCLFSSLDGARSFWREVRKKLPSVQNRPEIYGRQLYLDAADTIVGEEDTLLITASGIGFDEAPALVQSCGGVAVPAHIDRTSYSVLSVFGSIPDEPRFQTVEISADGDRQQLLQQCPGLSNARILTNSDAHRLWEISEKSNYLQSAQNCADLLKILNK